MALSRRKLIGWTGALVAGAAVTGGALIALRPPDRIFGKMVRRLLPGVKIDEAGLALFETEMSQALAASRKADLKMRVSLLASDILGYNTLSRVRFFSARAADIERAALSYFLLYSDFFPREENPDGPVTYFGIEDLPCPNPFVEFD